MWYADSGISPSRSRQTTEKEFCSQSSVPLINGIWYTDSSGTVRERFAVDAKSFPVGAESKYRTVTL